MTANFPKGRLWASPETVGEGVYRAIQRKRDVVYLPWFWEWVMFLIKIMPDSVVKKSQALSTLWRIYGV